MKRSLSSVVLAMLCTATWATDPLTGGNPEAGEKLAATCVACHGPAGNSSNPEWPKLAGQGGKYLIQQLEAFKSGERNNALMSPQAAALSTQDMRDIAAYYAAQAGSPGVAAESAVETAEPLHRGGDAARGVTACSACHGPAGAGNAAAAYPMLSGQHAKYTANSLRRLGSMTVNEATPVNLKIMAAVASKLTDQEIEALASYFQGLQ